MRLSLDGSELAMLRVYVANFWEGAFKGDFFAWLLSEAVNDKIIFVEKPADAEVIFTSVFGSESIPREKNISIIGENIRPNFALCSYSLSFDLDTYGGKNCYAPIWYAGIRWSDTNYQTSPNFKLAHGFEALIPPACLQRSRQLIGNWQDKKFCCLIASNPEGLRTNLYFALNKYKKVDGYGLMFSNPAFASKFEIIEGYKFCLCPENSLHPGYVTEKLFHAWYGGAIPIWYAPIGNVGGLLNQNAYLNYSEFQDIEKFVRHIIDLDSNPRIYQELHGEPLLLKEPSIRDVVKFLQRAILEILNHSRE